MPWKDDIQSAREEYRKQQAIHRKRVGIRRPQKKPSKTLIFIVGILEQAEPIIQKLKEKVRPYWWIMKDDLSALHLKLSGKERTLEDDVKDRIKEIQRKANR